tara:strand:+ start:126044 stop:127102 length:1059 start_codon:yes stop_codon:yes gene_type:complete
MFERLSVLAERLDKVRNQPLAEEATKTALILPFIRELGYDIFDPTEVIPEFTADVGIKKGEKVDYAICSDGLPIILFECKPIGAKLDSYSSQLYRYFSTTKARIAILTDGIVYRFYSDLINTNVLDAKPFFVLNLDRLTNEHSDRVRVFTKEHFDLSSVIADAETLYMKSLIREHFVRELANPSDDLVKLFVDPIHAGSMRQGVIEKYRPIVKSAISDHIGVAVEARLRSALNSSKEAEREPVETQPVEPQCEELGVVTTEDELNGFYIVKAILRDMVDPNRMVARDVQSYFGVLLDDNNRKPICRLHFNRKQWYLSVFDMDGKADRIPINSVDDLFLHADRLRASLQKVLD